MLLVSGLLVAITGDIQGKIMTEQQPMKMAAAEALWKTEQPASFSSLHDRQPRRDRGRLLDPDPVPAVVPGHRHLQRQGRGHQRPPGQEEAQFGPGDYTPNTPVTYWTFRWMIGVGALAALVAAWFLFRMRKGRMPAGDGRRGDPALPAAGRQLLRLDVHRDRPPAVDRVRPDDHGRRGLAADDAFMVLITMVGFTLLYGVLAVVMLGLVVRRVRAGLPEATSDRGFEHEAEPALGLGY